MIRHFFRPATIIGALPNNIQNGTTSDATTLMADLNWIVNQVNANAAAVATVALLAANNNFSVVQSGVDAQSLANFPTAQQVQKSEFITLSSVGGTGNAMTSHAPLSMAAYPRSGIFTFVQQQAMGSGGVTMNVNAISAEALLKRGLLALGSGDLIVNSAYIIRRIAPPEAMGTGFTVIGL